MVVLLLDDGINYNDACHWCKYPANISRLSIHTDNDYLHFDFHDSTDDSNVPIAIVIGVSSGNFTLMVKINDKYLKKTI